MELQDIVNVLNQITPGISWTKRSEGASVKEATTANQSATLPGDFFGRLNAYGIFIKEFEVKRSGLIARIIIRFQC